MRTGDTVPKINPSIPIKEPIIKVKIVTIISTFHKIWTGSLKRKHLIRAYSVSSPINPAEKATKIPYNILNAKRNKSKALSLIFMTLSTNCPPVVLTDCSNSKNCFW